MSIKKFLGGCILLLALYSCERKTDAKEFNADLSPVTTDNSNEIKQPIITLPDTVASNAPVINQTNIPPVDIDKKIIKTATLSLEVKSFRDYSVKIRNTIRRYGAYVAAEDHTAEAGLAHTSISIKVPVMQFEPMMNELQADDDVKIKENKISTEDVTDQVVDTKSRLEAKKQVRLKYLEFLKQSKNMTEVLEVQKEINGMQEEIESAAGRINSLSHSAAYSTINLSFSEIIVPDATVTDTPKEDLSFMTRISSSFMSGMHWIGELLVGLISVWPLWLLIIGGVWLLKRYSRKSTVKV